jgi:hypothetical protein
MLADPGNIFVVCVVAHVRDVRHSMTSLKDVIEAAIVVKVCCMQGKPTRREPGHRLKKIDFLFFSDITDTRFYPVATLEQSASHPTADKSRSPGNRNGRASWNG